MGDYAQMRDAIRRVNDRTDDIHLGCSRPGCEGTLRFVNGGVVCSDCRVAKLHH